MGNRTDLAIEFLNDSEKEVKNEYKIGKTEVIFHSLNSENSFNKREGNYATVKLGKIDFLTDFEEAYKAIILCLEKLACNSKEKVLVVGLGNREIISDSIGPAVAEKILATRHIKGDFAEKIGLKNLKSVAVLSPNVLGKTGIEASDTVKAIVDKIEPDLVIIIDALCAKNTENLFSVIQVCDSGISPGSGVKNSRKELSFETLGVPTIAIGIPTVVEAKTVAENLSKTPVSACEDLLLAPKETDLLTDKMSEILSHSLNIFLQPEIDSEIILALV